MKMLANVFLAIAVFSAASIASAEYCGGKINMLFVNKSGGVFLNGDWRNDYTQVCDVDSTWKAVSATTCKAWLAVATAAKVSSGTVLLSYGSYACGSLPTYANSPSPDYIMLKNPD